MSIVSTSSQTPRFSPADLPGLSLWLDATDAVSVTRSGSNVTSWEDKSGLQNRAVSRDGFPTYTTSGINGLPAVNFSNAPSMAGNLSITGTTVTGFLVIQGSQSGSNRNDQRILSCAASGAADWNSTARFLVGIQGGGNTVRYNRANTFIPQTTIPIGSPTLLSWLSDGTSNFIWEDGSAGDVLASVANGDTFSITNYALGNQFTTTTETYNGLIGEVLVYTTPLSTLQRQMVEGYLGRKWGLATVTGHPYRAGGPGILPTSLSGLRLWLDAADRSSFTFSSGSTISSWNDKSGNSRHATAVNGPTHVDASGAVLFTRASSQYFTLPDGTLPIGSSSFSIFFVYSPTSTGFEIQLITAGARGGNIFGIRSGNSATGTLQTFWSGNNDIETTNRWTVNARNLGSFFYQASGARSIWVNAAQGGGDTPASQTAITTGNSIGTLGAGAFNTFDGQMHEILVYGSSLSTAQRYLIEGYLANKWGFNSRLVSPMTSFGGPVIPMRPFTPRDIDGLTLWLDAADPSTLTLSGSNVTVWADKSGNGRNASAYQTGPVLSNSGLVFNATGVLQGSNADYLHNSSTGQWTVMAVFTASTTSIGNPRIFNYQGTPNAVAQFLYIEGGRLNSYIWASPALQQTGLTVVSNTAYLATVVNAASTVIQYANGTQTASNSHGSLPTVSNSNYYIGGFDTGASDRFYGTINEVLCFSNALTDVQRQQVENYLAAKWGLRGSMGGTAHPYRYGPPVIGTPATFLPTLQLWLDAQDSNAYTLSGSNVTAVLDKSSNAWSLGTATNVTLNSTKFNTTYPSFYNTFAGLGQNASFAIQQPITVYFAGQSLNTWGSAYLFDSINSSSRVAMNSGALFFAGSADVLPTNNSESLSPHVFCVTFNGANSSIVLNGTTTTGNPGSQGFNGIVLSKGDGYRGHICELLMFSGTHTTAQVQAMMGYLAWKWGIPSKLPGVSSNYARVSRALTPVFTPNQVQGCTLWLDGADTGTQTFSGSNLTQWRDKASTFVMDTVAPNCSLPVRGTAINGLSTIGITTGSMGIKQSTVINGVKNIFWVRRENGGNQGYQFYLGSDGNADFHTGDQGQFAHSGISPVGVRDASMSLFRVGGVTSGRMSTIEFPPGGGTLNILSVSNMTGDTRIQGISYDRGNTGRSITCDWGELLLYTTAVPVADIRRVEGYLAWKWGLQSYLPTGHPFKAVRP